jgi:hypothetical protein
MSETKYVKDSHGHIYIFVEQHHAERIGRGLEFVIRPQAEAQLKTPQKSRSYRTLQELREAAAKVGYEIPDGTPFAKAQNLFASFLKTQQSNRPAGEDLIGIGAFDNAGKQTD